MCIQQSLFKRASARGAPCGKEPVARTAEAVVGVPFDSRTIVSFRGGIVYSVNISLLDVRKFAKVRQQKKRPLSSPPRYHRVDERPPPQQPARRSRNQRERQSLSDIPRSSKTHQAKQREACAHQSFPHARAAQSGKRSVFVGLHDRASTRKGESSMRAAASLRAHLARGLIKQPFGVAGGLYDPESELVRFGARDYASDVGRWISRDAIRFRDGSNAWVCGDCDPIRHHDPTGFFSLPSGPPGELPLGCRYGQT